VLRQDASMSEQVISVCLASFNGEAWLPKQINSILPQLQPADELLIVDDASTDATCFIVTEFNDQRIKLIRNMVNIGVDQTFEKAISAARGDIIFLSDQDDVWYTEKVSKILQTFNNLPQTTLVLSDADVIDKDDVARGYTYFQNRGRFKRGVLSNLIKSKFLGCAMAFRSSMKPYFLPFPKQIPGHDMWIGLVNECYGRTEFIDKPLIAYRRHGNNASPESRSGILQMLTWRWQLAINLAKRLSKKQFLEPTERN